MTSELRGAGAPLPDAGKDTVARQKPRAYDMWLSSEVNMTNCFEHRKRFFGKYESIDCNLLIAYWMMAGYLGPVDSVQEAYKKGHNILMELTQQEILQSDASGEAEDMNKIAYSEAKDMYRIKLTENSNLKCRTHQGICDMEKVGLFDWLKLDELENVVRSDGMLKSVKPKKQRRKRSVLLIDGNHLSGQVFHSSKRLHCLAYFNPMPNSLKRLLENVNNLTVLLLRGCQFLSKIDDLSFDKLKSLTVLEISGSSHLTDIPEAIFSELTQLQCLNLSGLPIKQIEQQGEESSDRKQQSRRFSKLTELRWLILRGCSELEILPSIKDLKKLEVLDLSHCTSLKKLNSQVISSSVLRIIDLSYTILDTVPRIQSNQLTHLFLRDSKLAVTHQVNHLASIQVLDLSGAERVLEVGKLLQKNDLKVLDLSGTGIRTIDSVSDKVHLHKLLLKDCRYLEELPAMERLESLEVLDISGCHLITSLPDLSKLIKLEELDLSGTQVRDLPSFASPTCLRKLSLGGLQLDSLKTLESLSKVEALDLNGVKISSSVEFKVDFLESLLNLQSLNLSQTSVAELPSIAQLTSLKELLLAGCQKLNALPDLEALSNLEKLDLSLPDDSTAKNSQAEIESEVQRALSLSVPCSLRKLVLTNRSIGQELFPPATLEKLESLDLRGTDVTEILYEKLAQVKYIWLPAKLGHLKGMGNLKDEVFWDSNIYPPAEIKIVPSIGNKSSLSAGDNRFFHLRSNEESWEAFVYQFSVSHIPKGGENEVIYLERDEFIFRNNHSWARRLLGVELEGRSIEIHGFPKDHKGSPKGSHKDIPNGSPEDSGENILKGILDRLPQAHNVALVGYDFSGGLSYLCSMAMKVCCIRRCPNIKWVLCGKDENGSVPKCPERIVLSHLAGLESICDETVPPESIKGVKRIHIDCCPLLNKVIAPQVPENLETLRIKFCDKLQTLFKENATLSKLEELSLFQLPELEGITEDLSSLKRLERLSISQCHKLRNLDRVIKSAITSLKRLCLDSCPLLKHVFPSLDVPKNLEVLKISSCSGVVTLFEDTGSTSPSTCKLSIEQTLRLWNLPKLRNIGGQLSLALHIELDPSLPQNIKQQLSPP